MTETMKIFWGSLVICAAAYVIGARFANFHGMSGFLFVLVFWLAALTAIISGTIAFGSFIHRRIKNRGAREP